MKASEKIIIQLKERLKLSLPGAEAQYKMAPSLRPIPAEDFIQKMNPVSSSVLILLFPVQDNLFSVLIQRNEYNGVHSNQVSFPGGKKEKNDKSIEETALREAWEETGINPEKVRILGQLSSLYVPPSNFIIYPVIGFSESKPEFKSQIEEVKEIIEFPIALISLKETKKIKPIETSIGPVEAPYYDISGHTVWGATAMIISELEQILKEIYQRELPF